MTSYDEHTDDERRPLLVGTEHVQLPVPADDIQHGGNSPATHQGALWAADNTHKGALTTAEASLSEEQLLIPEGIGQLTTVVFLVGEMAGAGILSLPQAVVSTGWAGFLLLVALCAASAYTGATLGHCWTLVRQRYPELRGHVRYPYPAMGERAFGRWMRILLSVTINVNLFGGCTVFLIIAAQNVASLVAQAGVHVSFCYWSVVVACGLVPLTWLGTPKDFWPVAVAAFLCTAAACLLMCGQLLALVGHRTPTPLPHPDFWAVSLAFGTMAFAFGGTSTFPTIQADMRRPDRFPTAVYAAFAVLLVLYLLVVGPGYAVLGGAVGEDVLLSLPAGPLRAVIQLLITAHLLTAFIIVLNPLAQDLEELLGVPPVFGWRRCGARTMLLAAVLFLALSVPHFGALLALVGGATVSFLTFIVPCLLRLRLCSMRGDWPHERLPLFTRVLLLELVGLGMGVGVLATASALRTITSHDTFVPPCYINITAAAG